MVVWDSFGYKFVDVSSITLPPLQSSSNMALFDSRPVHLQWLCGIVSANIQEQTIECLLFCSFMLWREIHFPLCDCRKLVILLTVIRIYIFFPFLLIVEGLIWSNVPSVNFVSRKGKKRKRKKEVVLTMLNTFFWDYAFVRFLFVASLLIFLNSKKIILLRCIQFSSRIFESLCSPLSMINC